MGQHKYNKTAIDAKEGKLPPKEKPMSKREKDRWLYSEISKYMFRHGLPPIPSYYNDIK